MRNTRIVPLTLVVVACAAASVGATAGPAESAMSAQQSSALIRILADSEIWLPGFSAALARITNWERSGELTVAVFPDRIQGQRAFASNDSAGTALGQLNEFAQSPPPRPRPAAAAIFNRPAAAGLNLQAAVIPFAEDMKLHVAWRAGLNFLRPGIPVSRVQQKYGRPERVDRVIVQTESDRKPAILMLYRYADGAVTFVESDFRGNPGIVDRVVLNVRMLHVALFQE